MAITVYTKPSCVQCTATYRALDSKGIEYNVLDLSEDPAPPQVLAGKGMGLLFEKPSLRTRNSSSTMRRNSGEPVAGAAHKCSTRLGASAFRYPLLNAAMMPARSAASAAPTCSTV